MSVPVTVVTGFLGAGKTTFINRLLDQANGRRIAAIVNDFGAINIDAGLIATRTEDVIGLENGCICCSLQGDLLRTIKNLLSRPETFDQILIEASGVADPAGIVQALMDPVLWKAVSLNGVIAVVDVADCSDTPARLQDQLWRAQVANADYLAFSKADGIDLKALTATLKTFGKSLIVDLSRDAFPAEVLIGGGPEREYDTGRGLVTSDRFVTVEGQWPSTVPMAKFQGAIQRLSPQLVRAKGIINFTEQPGKSFVFQLVGKRATLEPLDKHDAISRLVLIGERSHLDAELAQRELATLFMS
ncbi:CobW family GTP-binding protein [Devosia sp. SD17-2]|uniref:CobW family GTP-binding protein n=1 Tax=Devosia sp. SD17-2 TaxID=2976459 RepID=UPI0023D853FA|nr:CobW family GTP-binding protein [Devosia sp. SD17-2]WEJ35008.1 GTP-binding protein [Devosia sp. SD17-2]